jgi:hypothetical protein
MAFLENNSILENSYHVLFLFPLFQFYRRVEQLQQQDLLVNEQIYAEDGMTE